MSTTVVEVSAGVERARVTLHAGAVVPRLVARGRASARIALVAGGALLLGGDAIEVRVTVGAGCSLAIEDVGGTVAYDGEGRSSSWGAVVHVGDGASLTWQGLPFVVADGADVDRRTDVRLGAGATVVVRETIVLGRAGERGGVVRARTDVADAAGPLLAEMVLLDGHRPAPGVVGAHRVLDTIMRFGDDPPVGPGGAGDLLVPPSRSGDLALLRPERGGMLLRALGSETHRTDLGRFWAPVVGATREEAVDVVAG